MSVDHCLRARQSSVYLSTKQKQHAYVQKGFGQPHRVELAWLAFYADGKSSITPLPAQLEGIIGIIP